MKLHVVIRCGFFALVLGTLAFILNWNVWQGGMPGYGILLFPGNLFLSMFTEEINFWPKLILLLFGQFLIPTMTAAIVIKVINRIHTKRVG